MQLAAKEIKDDLKHSMVTAKPWRTKALVYFGVVFVVIIALTVGYSTRGVHARMGFKMWSVVMLGVVFGGGIGMSLAMMQMPLAAKNYNWLIAKLVLRPKNPSWLERQKLKWPVDVRDVVDRMSLRVLIHSSREKFGFPKYKPSVGMRVKIVAKKKSDCARA